MIFVIDMIVYRLKSLCFRGKRGSRRYIAKDAASSHDFRQVLAFYDSAISRGYFSWSSKWFTHSCDGRAVFARRALDCGRTREDDAESKSGTKYRPSSIQPFPVFVGYRAALYYRANISNE